MVVSAYTAVCASVDLLYAINASLVGLLVFVGAEAKVHVPVGKSQAGALILLLGVEYQRAAEIGRGVCGGDCYRAAVYRKTGRYFDGIETVFVRTATLVAGDEVHDVRGRIDYRGA